MFWGVQDGEEPKGEVAPLVRPGERIVCEVCGVNVQRDAVRRSATGWRHEPDACMQRHYLPANTRVWRIAILASPNEVSLHNLDLFPGDTDITVDHCEVRADPVEPTRHVCEKGHNILLIPETARSWSWGSRRGSGDGEE